MGFLGFANVYAMRVNLSVAIVAMVNNTAIASNSSVIDNSTCPVAANSTEGPRLMALLPGEPRSKGGFWELSSSDIGLTQLPGADWQRNMEERDSMVAAFSSLRSSLFS